MSGRTAQPARSPDVTREIDATGLSCPMPVIELAKAVDGLEVGQVVGLVATDPAAQVDVPVWCRMQRQTLLETHQREGSWRFLVQRAR